MARGPNYQKERGERQEARMLKLLEESPKTIDQLAEKLAMSTANVRIYLRRMSDTPKRVHISFYAPPVSGRPTPVWGLGAKDDALYLPKRISAPIPRREDRLKQVRKLLTTPRTANELGALMHITNNRVRVYLKELREESKREVFIKGWRHPGKRGDLAPIYALGNKPDAPKPQETRAQRYAKEKADPEKYDRILAKRRAANRVATARKTPQNVFSALGL